ncbi:MAG: two-component sensor histidine kinase, partial [Bifidobacterium mongoliense]|nr:two-component sensor histidine kinase [Bifidobacterium mongoliense]
MWWRYALSIGVFLAVVLTIAVRVGLVLGRRSAREHGGSPAARAGVLVGEGWSDDAERRLIALMPYAMLVLTGQGLVRYQSPDARDLGIVENDRLTDPGIEAVLRRVVADERVRELEIHVRQSSPRSVDGGGEGQDQDVDGEYLRVRAGAVGPNLYAVFLSDITEQRRFASMRRDFVTNVSHELKTPAGAISLLAETISDAADDATAVRYFAQRIIKESQRLTQLVHRLIDLQRVQDPQVVRNPEVLDVVALARDAIGMNLTLAQTGGVGLLLDLEGRRIADGDVVAHGPSVRADRTSLTTALKNLIENAIRYSPDRTAVTIDVRSRGERALI